MTNEEAIKLIEPLCLACADNENFECCGDCNNCKDEHANKLQEAKNMAIKALKQFQI